MNTASMEARGPDAVRASFADQVHYCEKNGAPITARIVSAIGEAVKRSPVNPFLDRVRNWSGPVLADGVPLRCAGGLHALHLTGQAPELAPVYRGEAADDVSIVAAVIERHVEALLTWLDGPPQTNEAGRSSSFVAAMLWLADRGLPSRFECLEIGASAGINLMMDRYAYDLGGVNVGPSQPVMRLAPEWRGPPPPDGHIEIARLKGCDVAPVDLTDPAQALRLRAYTWPEQRERFVRLEAAIAAAKDRPPDLVKLNAADFIEAELARPQENGTTRLLMHSIVWQYVLPDQQARVTAAMNAAGRNATAERPLAWVALETDRAMAEHQLTVRYWPGGEKALMLGRAHAHGAWLEWSGETRPLS